MGVLMQQTLEDNCSTYQLMVIYWGDLRDIRYGTTWGGGELYCLRAADTQIRSRLVVHSWYKRQCAGGMTEWPALRRWPDLNYLLEKAGSRTVPVELGSSYSDSDWSQKLMSLRDFITLHVHKSKTDPGDKLGYLAQHQLFNQVRGERKDV